MIKLNVVLAGGLLLLSGLCAAAERYHSGSGGYPDESYPPDIGVAVPPEVFSSGGHRPPPCNQCCIYQDQNYSEGAVVNADGIVLQCQRDEKTLSTNPLVWRRVRT
nr:YnjH family protein [Franconibacter helveticus]